MKKIPVFIHLIISLLAIVSLSNQAIAQETEKSDGIKLIVPPTDPQIIQDQDDMTWKDYHPIPGHDWADPALNPPRQMKIALVAIDFPDRPFVITLPDWLSIRMAIMWDLYRDINYRGEQHGLFVLNGLPGEV
jgi:hypothetical protein